MPRDEVAQLGDRLLGLAVGAGDQLLRALGVGGELLLGHAEVHRQRDEPRLGAVVEVALDALQLGRLGIDGAGAGALELLEAAALARRQQRRGRARPCRSRRRASAGTVTASSTRPAGMDRERLGQGVDGEQPVVDAAGDRPVPGRQEDHPDRDAPQCTDEGEAREPRTGARSAATAGPSRLRRRRSRCGDSRASRGGGSAGSRLGIGSRSSQPCAGARRARRSASRRRSA